MPVTSGRQRALVVNGVQLMPTRVSVEILVSLRCSRGKSLLLQILAHGDRLHVGVREQVRIRAVSRLVLDVFLASTRRVLRRESLLGAHLLEDRPRAELRSEELIERCEDLVALLLLHRVVLQRCR